MRPGGRDTSPKGRSTVRPESTSQGPPAGFQSRPGLPPRQGYRPVRGFPVGPGGYQQDQEHQGKNQGVPGFRGDSAIPDKTRDSRPLRRYPGFPGPGNAPAGRRRFFLGRGSRCRNRWLLVGGTGRQRPTTERPDGSQIKSSLALSGKAETWSIGASLPDPARRPYLQHVNVNASNEDPRSRRQLEMPGPDRHAGKGCTSRAQQRHRRSGFTASALGHVHGHWPTRADPAGHHAGP